MILKKITLNNIRSYEHQEVKFTEGSTLLSGDIGSGKTSILLGIEFALFGLQPGQRGSLLLRNQEKQGGVIMEFEVDGKEIIVERTLKKSSKNISQDYCAITIDNEKNELAVTELKNKILKLLDYPKEFSKKQNILYKFTVYTPQEEMKQIILQDSETRLNTLRHVFGIDKYKKVLENTAILASKIREEKRIKQGFTEALELDKQDIISKENELELKQKSLVLIEEDFLLKKENRKKIEEEKQGIYEKIKEKNKFEQEVEKTKLMISAKRENLSENKKLIIELENQIEELSKLFFDKSKILTLENEIKFKKQEKENFNQNNLVISSQINSLNLKNEELRKLEQKISNLEVCPTCLQEVDAVYRANVLNKIHNDFSQNNQRLDSLELEKKQISEKIKLANLEIDSKEKEATELKMNEIKLQGIIEKQSRLAEVKNLNISFERDVEILDRHIETLNQSVFELRKFDSLFESKQKQFENASREERILEIGIAELKREIKVFSSQIQESKEKIKKAEEVRRQLNYLTKLETWLSKEFSSFVTLIEKNVMIKLKTEFSKLFDEWFCMLVSDSFDVSLTDDFTPIIEYQDYEIDYAYLSGGERTAVALAYRLALNQVINSLMSKIKTRDIVILDEPTDGFSEQQLGKMQDVLQQLNIKQLIIVSHEQKIEGFVENIIRFRKVNGVSQRE